MQFGHLYSLTPGQLRGTGLLTCQKEEYKQVKNGINNLSIKQ